MSTFTTRRSFDSWVPLGLAQLPGRPLGMATLAGQGRSPVLSGLAKRRSAVAAGASERPFPGPVLARSCASGAGRVVFGCGTLLLAIVAGILYCPKLSLLVSTFLYETAKM
jgi:hypothetical protein